MDIDVEQIAKLDHENALCDDLCELAEIASNCVFHKVTEKQIDRAKHILETINCFCTRNKLDPVYSPTDDIETALKQWFFNMLNRDKLGKIQYKLEEIENKIIESLVDINIRDKTIEIVKEHADEEASREDLEKKRKKFRQEHKKEYENDNVIIKTAFGKKWSKTFKYDYDSSIWSTYILGRTIEQTFDISNKDNSHYCYEISFDGKSKFSGDTMNSWSTTLDEFFRLYGDEYLNNLKKGKNKKWCPQIKQEWVEFLSESDNYKKNVTLPPYITKFMECVYTIGNFVLLPQNRPYRYGDYWDLFLACVYNHFHPEPKTMITNENGKAYTLESYNTARKKEKYSEWLEKYGSDEKGWNEFVKKNFMDPFVDGKDEKFGKPKELWDNHFKSSIMPQKEKQFEDFFENATERILERGERIAKALIDELKENETQK